MVALKLISRLPFILLWIILIGIGSFSFDLSEMKNLLPEIPGWSLASSPEFYEPARLFEYINGASEAYLAYDFQGLLVAQYVRDRSAEPLLTVEIYDMGSSENAFGIYSAERPGGGNFLEVGLEGYLEQGSLNFFSGRYYVKILCFLEAEEGDKVALLFGQEVSRRIPEPGQWPEALSLFPSFGLIPHSQRFILKNFLGFNYLHHGYLTRYRREGIEFEAFLIQGKDRGDAEEIEKKLSRDLAGPEGLIKDIPSGRHLRSRYFQNVYLRRSGANIFGLMRLPDDQEKMALSFLAEFSALIEKR